MRSRSSVTAADYLLALGLPPRPDRVPERPGRHEQGQRLEEDRRTEVRYVEQRQAHEAQDPDAQPDQRVATPAVSGQRVEAEQHQH